MKKAIAFLIVAVFAISMVGPVSAQQKEQGNLKVGYVDLNAVLEAFQPYRDAMEELEQYRSDIQEEIDQDRNQIGQLQEELQDSEFLSREQQQQKQQELQERMQAFRQSRQRSQQLMQRKEQELLSPVRERVQEAVKLTAEELNYDVVHRYGGRQPSTVLWVSPDVDLTEQVIERLDQVKPVNDGDESSSE